MFSQNQFRPRCASYVNTLFPPDKDRCNLAGFACFTPWTGGHLPCLTWTRLIINEHSMIVIDWLKRQFLVNILNKYLYYSAPLVSSPFALQAPSTSLTSPILRKIWRSPTSWPWVFPIGPQLFAACCHVAGRHLTTHSGANRWSIPVASNACDGSLA